MKKLTAAAIVAAAMVIAAAAFAQAPATTKKPSKLKTLLSKMHKPKPGTAAGSSSGSLTGRRRHSPIAAAAVSGRIIGNKSTHVYHLPGSGGNLPSAANTVYFKSEAQAIAAGYHKAGVGGKKRK